MTNLIAQIPDGVFSNDNLASRAAQVSGAVSQGFEELWKEVLGGQLYGSLCDVGTLFAIATLGFYILEWTKQVLNNEEQRAFSSFIWPLLISALLFNDGQLLGKTTVAIKDYINNVNTYVLTRTAVGVDLRAAYSKALGVSAVRAAIGREIEACRTSSLSPQETVECLEQAKEALSRQYPSYFRAKGPFAWLIDRIDRIISAPQQAIESGANPIQVLLSPFSAFVGSVVAENITNILVGLSGAYQWGIELTMLLTAYLGPLAVGGSLLPYGSKPILAWLIGYFSVGMAKLSFNIIAGFAAELIANSRSDQPLFFLFTIGIFAPALATGIAAGGGLSLLVQINKAADEAKNVAKDIAVTVVTGGAGGITRLVRPK
ncbi:hypothetical protein A6770_32325 [Nostoc minutum NIES-26]|uniref:NAD/NADP transhydrogenase beta subunit n=1 Tax=Nostoc minutum NIES-26 TaxID=1844469 RepID=A0A367Q5N4_9NOSO|nr:hypothetical protein A6770_32325 [Nostoc minutum NIES-26]